MKARGAGFLRTDDDQVGKHQHDLSTDAVDRQSGRLTATAERAWRTDAAVVPPGW